MVEFNESCPFSVSPDVNEWYKIYCLAYLNFNDDNEKKFWIRETAYQPYYSIKDEELKDNDEVICEVYRNAAMSFLSQVLSSGYYKSFDALYEDFPFDVLRCERKNLESLFYDD